jgi:hypothetical protein
MKATLLLLLAFSSFVNAEGYMHVDDGRGPDCGMWVPIPSISNGASAAVMQGSSYYTGFPYQEGVTDGKAYHSNTHEVAVGMNENYDAIIKGGKNGYKVYLGSQVFDIKKVIAFAKFMRTIEDNKSHSFQLNDKCLAWVKGDKVRIGNQEFDADSFLQFLN